MSQSPITPAVLLSIAAGSALGGMARYLMTIAVQSRTGAAFPVGTLAVNITGCLVLGALVAFLPGRTSPATHLLLTTGFCGGFTTFSTFSYETVLLMQQGLWARASGYVALSLGVGLAAFWIGYTAVRLTVGRDAPA